jgi:hypothetical protein
MRKWCSYGVKVVISLDDFTTKSSVRAVLSKANRLGQVDVLFNLAMVSVMLGHIYIAHLVSISLLQSHVQHYVL